MLQKTMQSSIDEGFMRIAIGEAKKAKAAGDLPFGAVVVCNNKIVGIGKAENNTIGDVADHAELLAVRAACKSLGRNNLKDCTIYCSNEPCLMCAAAIFQAKIPKITFALSRSDLPHLLRERKLRIEDVAADAGYDSQIIKGVRKAEALELFADVKK